jgi:hypothetical protein
MVQLALPGFPLICPACREHASVLGQWSPFRRDAVCRTCSTAHPYPIHILEPHPKKPGELAIKRDADQHLLSDHTGLTNWLWDAVRGCRDIAEGRSTWCADEVRPCQLGKERPDCQLCSRRLLTGSSRYWTYRVGFIVEQQPIPLCHRCGQPHERRRLSGVYAELCERCEMERSVEALFRHRSIFGTDDVEAILDKLYQSHRACFEAGVLPDYWFKLTREAMEVVG